MGGLDSVDKELRMTQEYRWISAFFAEQLKKEGKEKQTFELCRTWKSEILPVWHMSDGNHAQATKEQGVEVQAIDRIWILKSINSARDKKRGRYTMFLI